jgi:hypothetical protein
MGKVAFVGSGTMSPFFALLGCDCIVPEAGTTLDNLHHYDILFSDDETYEQLRKNYPHKAIIPLVDLERRKFFINERIVAYIKSTVGAAPLNHE